MSLVSISIVGNVIKQPEQYSFSSGKTKTTLVVAVDNPTRKKDDGHSESDVYRVEAWGKLGEVAHKYLTKGSLVGATGRLVMNHWQDRLGHDRVTPIVEANQIALPPKPKAANSDSESTRTNPVAGEMQFDKPGELAAPSVSTPPEMAAAPAAAISEEDAEALFGNAGSTEEVKSEAELDEGEEDDISEERRTRG